MSNSYKGSMPWITSWDSINDANQLAQTFAQANPDAPSEMGTGDYWVNKAGITSLDSENDFNTIDRLMGEYSSSGSGSAPAAGGYVDPTGNDSRVEAVERSRAVLEASRPVYDSSIGEGTDAAAAYGNQSAIYAQDYGDYLDAENALSSEEARFASRSNLHRYVGAPPDAPDIGKLYDQYSRDFS